MYVRKYTILTVLICTCMVHSGYYFKLSDVWDESLMCCCFFSSLLPFLLFLVCTFTCILLNAYVLRVRTCVCMYVLNRNNERFNFERSRD